MLEVEIGDVAEAIANLTERGAVDPVVKATLTLSESGFVSVSDAVVFGEIKDESISGTLPRIFIFFSIHLILYLQVKLKVSLEVPLRRAKPP